MFCKNCGKEAKNNANFCSECGTNIGENILPVNQELHQFLVHKNKLYEFIINLFRGRLGRLDYLLLLIISMLFFGIISSVILTALSSLTGDFSEGLGVIAIIIDMFVILLLALSAHIRRLHDIGMSGFWVLIMPIPLVGLIFFLVLLFNGGDSKPNKYGEVNNKKNFLKRIFGLK